MKYTLLPKNQIYQFKSLVIGQVFRFDLIESGLYIKLASNYYLEFGALERQTVHQAIDSKHIVFPVEIVEIIVQDKP